LIKAKDDKQLKNRARKRLSAENLKELVDKIYQGEKYLNREEFLL